MPYINESLRYCELVERGNESISVGDNYIEEGTKFPSRLGYSKALLFTYPRYICRNYYLRTSPSHLPSSPNIYEIDSLLT